MSDIIIIVQTFSAELQVQPARRKGRMPSHRNLPFPQFGSYKFFSPNFPLSLLCASPCLCWTSPAQVKVRRTHRRTQVETICQIKGQASCHKSRQAACPSMSSNLSFPTLYAIHNVPFLILHFVLQTPIQADIPY